MNDSIEFYCNSVFEAQGGPSIAYLENKEEVPNLTRKMNSNTASKDLIKLVRRNKNLFN